LPGGVRVTGLPDAGRAGAPDGGNHGRLAAGASDRASDSAIEQCAPLEISDMA